MGVDSKGAEKRVQALFDERYRALTSRVDRMFTWLILAQWIAAILFAWLFSPLAWAGRESMVHSHVFAAVFLGGAISSLPLFLGFRRPGEQSTRYVIACGQVLWSALLIHLTGGRIETHFHVFASLAILAFYRDLKVLVPATVVVAADHFLRGVYWPESVYGIANPEWWRFLEHAGWVIFLDAFLLYNCAQSYSELRTYCEHQIALDEANESVARNEKLAAVGQLAASVGHELRNPLAAIRNAAVFIDKKLEKSGAVDPKVQQFFGIIRRELDASDKIIGNLLDFARPRQAVREPCPLRPLVEEVLTLVPMPGHVSVLNEVPDDLPVPDLDKDQFRQALMNLVQNGVESVPNGNPGRVVVGASLGEGSSWLITVTDDGTGIPADKLDDIFQPLFSTKVKGTGLGLPVVRSMIERHGGTLSVRSQVGSGTTFVIDLPPRTGAQAA